MSIRVYWLDCRGVDPAQVWHLMSDRRREKIAQISPEAGKRQSAAAELALVRALARERNAEEEKIKWHAREDGKPVIDGGPHFSLSHSGDIAVCALCEQEVGVDIERCRKISPAMRRVVFSQAEEECSDAQLLKTWVAKESFLKMTGEGIRRRMNGIAVCDSCILDETGRKTACVQAIPFPLEGYELCVCSEQVEDIQLIRLDE